MEERFIDAAVDFIRTYADQVHHGKEEDILFCRLAGKTPYPRTIVGIMQELQCRTIPGGGTPPPVCWQPRKEYPAGQTAALIELLDICTSLVDFYPRHIEKEDQHFFIPIMAYFSKEEKELLLARMAAFDRDFIHVKYQKIVADWEAQRL